MIYQVIYIANPLGSIQRVVNQLLDAEAPVTGTNPGQISQHPTGYTQLHLDPGWTTSSLQQVWIPLARAE
jgi:hypothetical protein